MQFNLCVCRWKRCPPCWNQTILTVTSTSLLRKKRKSEVPFWCDGCKELGLGSCYQCPITNYNFIVHKECQNPRLTLSSHQISESWDFQFHKESPTGRGTRNYDVCVSEIHGFSWRARSTSTLRAFSLPDSDKAIYEIKSRCLKCQSKKRSSGKVQGLSYVSSDGKLCYHVACLNEALVENWRNGMLTTEANANGESSRSLELQNLAPNQVARPQSSRAMRKLKWLITFLKLLISALLGDHFTLLSTLCRVVLRGYFPLSVTWLWFGLYSISSC